MRGSRDPRLLAVSVERRLAERIKRGDRDARTQLILANQRLVVSIVRRYRSRTLTFEDLVQEGNLGLIRASQDFDPSLHGARFSSYAVLWIKSFVHRALVANDSLIRIPEHLFFLRKRYRRAMGLPGSASMIGMGSAATEQSDIEHLAGEMRISPGKLGPSRILSIEQGHHPEADADGEARALAEVLDDGRRPEEEVVDHEVRGLLNAALRQLNPVEAWVIRERYGLHVLAADDRIWAEPSPRAGARGSRDRPPEAQADPSGSCPTRLRRTYAELERDCGLSTHRIRQMERAALDKLRRLLAPFFDQDR